MGSHYVSGVEVTQKQEVWIRVHMTKEPAKDGRSNGAWTRKNGEGSVPTIRAERSMQMIASFISTTPSVLFTGKKVFLLCSVHSTASWIEVNDFRANAHEGFWPISPRKPRCVSCRARWIALPCMIQSLYPAILVLRSVISVYSYSLLYL